MKHSNIDCATTLGNRIRAAREKRDLSQESLAERADLHPTYIGQVERGEKNLTIVSLLKISAALGIPPEALVKGLSLSGANNLSKEKLELIDLIISLPDKKAKRVLISPLELLTLFLQFPSDSVRD